MDMRSGGRGPSMAVVNRRAPSPRCRVSLAGPTYGASPVALGEPLAASMTRSWRRPEIHPAACRRRIRLRRSRRSFAGDLRSRPPRPLLEAAHPADGCPRPLLTSRGYRRRGTPHQRRYPHGGLDRSRPGPPPPGPRRIAPVSSSRCACHQLLERGSAFLGGQQTIRGGLRRPRPPWRDPWQPGPDPGGVREGERSADPRDPILRSILAESLSRRSAACRARCAVAIAVPGALVPCPPADGARPRCATDPAGLPPYPGALRPFPGALRALGALVAVRFLPARDARAAPRLRRPDLDRRRSDPDPRRLARLPRACPRCRRGLGPRPEPS